MILTGFLHWIHHNDIALLAYKILGFTIAGVSVFYGLLSLCRLVPARVRGVIKRRS